MPEPGRPTEIHHDLLIVGEGTGDASLIGHLTENRGIDGFQIEDAGGSSKFQAFIAGLAALKGIARLKALIVVADSDAGADTSFKHIRTQMKAARIPYPQTPYTFAIQPNMGTYATYVLMIPFSIGPPITANTGALETLLLPSAEEHFSSHIRCLDSWCACLQMDGWSKTSRDKARLRSLLAAAHPEDPNISLRLAVIPNKDLIPLGHQCFDALADLLRSLPQQVLDLGL
jgi:hypothetical protein